MTDKHTQFVETAVELFEKYYPIWLEKEGVPDRVTARVDFYSELRMRFQVEPMDDDVNQELVLEKLNELKIKYQRVVKLDWHLRKYVR